MKREDLDTLESTAASLLAAHAGRLTPAQLITVSGRAIAELGVTEDRAQLRCRLAGVLGGYQMWFAHTNTTAMDADGSALRWCAGRHAGVDLVRIFDRGQIVVAAAQRDLAWAAVVDGADVVRVICPEFPGRSVELVDAQWVPVLGRSER
jgi:hypothetical protein